MVAFVSDEMNGLALERNKWSLGQRWIDVFPATVSDLTMLQNAPKAAESTVVWLRGLPYGAKEVRMPGSVYIYIYVCVCTVCYLHEMLLQHHFVLLF